MQDVLRAYKVLVDGKVVGSIRRRETKSFDVGAGHHEIHLAMGKFTSMQLYLDLAPGQDVRLVCRARPAKAWAWKMPNMYMELEVEGPGSGAST